MKRMATWFIERSKTHFSVSMCRNLTQGSLYDVGGVVEIQAANKGLRAFFRNSGLR